MDERITGILKTLAYGEVGSNDMGDSICLYCDFNLYAESDDENGLHCLDCPIRVARAILKEQGTPILLYRIEYEMRHAFSPFGWFAVKVMRLAFSEQEALQGYEDSPNPNDVSNSKKRNAKATLIREVL